MHPARVTGRVVATSKYKHLEGVKLLMLQPTDWEGTPDGDYLVAAD
ncbi:MAG: EutN/CcmL family microcompartment protein, partial [Vulcanimicrobiota bacterium]